MKKKEAQEALNNYYPCANCIIGKVYNCLPLLFWSNCWTAEKEITKKKKDLEDKCGKILALPSAEHAFLNQKNL